LLIFQKLTIKIKLIIISPSLYMLPGLWVFVSKTQCLFSRAHRKTLNEDRCILSAAKCRPMILVSRYIRYYVDILGGSLGGASIVRWHLVFMCASVHPLIWTCTHVYYLLLQVIKH